MTVHLVKMCVGIENVEHLTRVQADRLQRARETESEPALCHITRHTPKRAAELCEDGSLYWVVRGFIAVRQRVLACERRVNSEGRPSCALVLDPALVRTELRATRPFQGWRYLAPEKAPRDLAASDGGSAELPPEIADELRALGLL